MGVGVDVGRGVGVGVCVGTGVAVGGSSVGVDVGVGTATSSTPDFSNVGVGVPFSTKIPGIGERVGSGVFSLPLVGEVVIVGVGKLVTVICVAIDSLISIVDTIFVPFSLLPLII